MKIVLSGVETNNKGAELMLYAILQEIERRWPKAEVFIPHSRCPQGLKYINTSVTFKYTPLSRLVDVLHISSVLNRLHLPNSFLVKTSIINDADWFLDGSGFVFSDQWNPTMTDVMRWEAVLRSLYKSGSKIVFLPQAFGPFEKENSRRLLIILSRYANLVVPREKVSYGFIEKSGLMDMRRIKVFPDFTSLVDGVFPIKYDYLKNGICLIPNYQMIAKGKVLFDDYINLLKSLVREGKQSGHPVYLLNHEGQQDEDLCYKCQQSITDGIEVVTGLNALEVKGLIGSAYVVVTSRFHGLASALNCFVPSLATSWSHKYQELFNDYGLGSYLLPLNSIETAVDHLKELLNPIANLRIRKHLETQALVQKQRTKEMWDAIWSI